MKRKKNNTIETTFLIRGNKSEGTDERRKTKKVAETGFLKNADKTGYSKSTKKIGLQLEGERMLIYQQPDIREAKLFWSKKEKWIGKITTEKPNG